MPKYFDDSMALSGRPFSRLKDYGFWTEGEVATPHGFVTVYSEQNYSRVDFIYNGRLHMRTTRRYLSKIGLARMASKFAKEIVEKGV